MNRDKAAADVLLSRIVRSRGRCERCGSGRDLECAHIVPRRYAATRCDEANVLCLCHACHADFTEHPDAFYAWCRVRLGDELDVLWRRARAPVAANGAFWRAERDRLTRRWAEVCA